MRGIFVRCFNMCYDAAIEGTIHSTNKCMLQRMKVGDEGSIYTMLWEEVQEHY